MWRGFALGNPMISLNKTLITEQSGVLFQLSSFWMEL